MAIQQGDKYSLPVVVKQGDTVVTAEMVQTMKIGIGQFTQKWPNGKLSYEDGRWMFDLTPVYSTTLVGKAPFQVQAKLTNGDIFHSAVNYVEVKASTIRGC